MESTSDASLVLPCTTIKYSDNYYCYYLFAKSMTNHVYMINENTKWNGKCDANEYVCELMVSKRKTSLIQNKSMPILFSTDFIN
jgi:hypothetical protein